MPEQPTIHLHAPLIPDRHGERLGLETIGVVCCECGWERRGAGEWYAPRTHLGRVRQSKWSSK